MPYTNIFNDIQASTCVLTILLTNNTHADPNNLVIGNFKVTGIDTVIKK